MWCEGRRVTIQKRRNILNFLSVEYMLSVPLTIEPVQNADKYIGTSRPHGRPNCAYERKPICRHKLQAAFEGFTLGDRIRSDQANSATGNYQCTRSSQKVRRKIRIADRPQVCV